MIKETISEYSRKFIKLEQEFSPLDKICANKKGKSLKAPKEKR